MSPKLNGEVLSSIAHTSHTATVTATALAMRDRNRSFSDVTRMKRELIKAGEKIVEAEYYEFWKDLSAKGIGSLIYGRNGSGDRFEWHYDLKKVANSMINGTSETVEKLEAAQAEIVDAPKEERKPRRIIVKKKESKEAPVSAQQQSEKIVYIRLRPNFGLRIALPGDINANEIGIIADAIKETL